MLATATLHFDFDFTTEERIITALTNDNEIVCAVCGYNMADTYSKISALLSELGYIEI